MWYLGLNNYVRQTVRVTLSPGVFLSVIADLAKFFGKCYEALCQLLYSARKL